MRSKKSFFSKTVFAKNLTRFWPVWVSYLCILLLIMIVFNVEAMHYMDAEEIGYQLFSIESRETAILVFVYGLLSAAAVFSYLYTPKSASMMASLPISRTGMFWTHYLSGLCWMVGANLVTAILLFAVQSLMGCASVLYIAQWFIIGSLMTLFFYSFAAFCAMLTGHLAALAAVYVILNFVAVMVEALVKSVAEIIVYGMEFTSFMQLKILSPLVNLVSHQDIYIVAQSAGKSEIYSFYDSAALSNFDSVKLVYHNWEVLIIYAAAAVLLAVGAMLLFRRRNMEAASDIVAVRVFKPVFKYCLTFGTALCLAIMLYSVLELPKNQFTVWILAAFMLLGGCIGYFAAEMLMQKSFRVFSRWKGFVIAACVMLLLLCAGEFDLLGYEKSVPSPENIEAVDVYMWDHAELKEQDNITAVTELQKNLIADKRLYESGNVEGECPDTLQIAYQMKDGTMINRVYQIPISENLYKQPGSVLHQIDALLNSKEGIMNRIDPGFAVDERSILSCQIQCYNYKTDGYDELSLSAQEAAELYNTCIWPDAGEGKIGKIQLYDCEDQEYDNSVSVAMELRNPEEHNENAYLYFEVQVLPDSARTVQYLEQHGLKLENMEIG